jgi:nitric oxide reductase NorQ protein
MTKKWTNEDIHPEAVMETTFWPNPVADSGFRFRATHLDGRRAPKVVLCDDSRIRPGVPCLVKIKAVRKPRRDDRGAIEVEFVQTQQFRIEGVYLDPIVAKKLQVLLESGMNILNG